MYEEQKMEYDRVKFPTEIVSEICVTKSTIIENGALLSWSEDGYVPYNGADNKQYTVVVVGEKILEDEYYFVVNAIVSGEVDFDFVKIFTGTKYEKLSSINNNIYINNFNLSGSRIVFKRAI